ncbi:MAG TPA: hypothetical protein VGK00_12490 [Anaerolineales bacterium]|jgi:uncharacterized membrane protein
MSTKKSQRFKPSSLAEKFVPVLFALILLGLLAVIVLVVLAMLGLTPGA